jgi:hypothetical protein
MKSVRHYYTEQGTLKLLEEGDKLLTLIWLDNETLKIEVWPRELKISPCRQIPYQLNSQSKKKEYVEKILRGTAEYRARKADEATWPNQTPLIRVDQASTPYTQEFARFNDSRSRPHLSKKLSQGRRNSQKSPPQTDAPF